MNWGVSERTDEVTLVGDSVSGALEQPRVLPGPVAVRRPPTVAYHFGVKWVSLSFPQFGEIGGNAGFDDGVVGGRSDGHRLLDKAVEQEATGL